MSAEAKPAGVVGDIDTTYLTQQRDMFGSGLVAQIGSAALTVWLAIKSHADFQTGEAWPGVRRLMELTGMASITVQDAIRKLLDAHMLRPILLDSRSMWASRSFLMASCTVMEAIPVSSMSLRTPGQASPV